MPGLIENSQKEENGSLSHRALGSVDGIVLGSSENPRPGRKEILMPVRASSLDYRDLMVLKGGGRGPTKIGVVPLFDGGQPLAFPAVQKSGAPHRWYMRNASCS
jgi:hypothetical protein